MHHGARAVDAELGEQRAERREQTGMGRHDDTGHPEMRGDIDGVEGARAAKGDEREVAVIDAAIDGHQTNRVRHVLRRRVEDGERRLLHTEPDIAGQRLDRAPRRLGVEADFAAEEEVGIEAAQHDIGVGDGGLGAAAAVAGRAGVGARAARPDAQQPPRVDVGDRAAAGADRGVVDEE